MNPFVQVNIKKLIPEATIPSYSKEGDACMDVVATSIEYNTEHDYYIYHTGLAFEVPKGYEMQIRPRSSIRNTDGYICNTPGTLDAGYRGELLICMKNRYSHLLLTQSHCLNEQMSQIFFKNTECLKYINDDYYKIINKGDIKMEYAPYKVGERIAQITIIPFPSIVWSEIESLSDSERGEHGFGSTGK